MAKRKTGSRSRTAGLQMLLESKQRQLMIDLGDSVRRLRTAADSARAAEQQDGSSRESYDDLDTALVQMKSETLARIELALRRLGDGTYGNCAECGQPIPTARLEALPFAVRCAPCEGAREKSVARGAVRTTRAYPHPLDA
jgi:RNA polymerase-binding transcription factor